MSTLSSHQASPTARFKSIMSFPEDWEQWEVKLAVPHENCEQTDAEKGIY